MNDSKETGKIRFWHRVFDWYLALKGFNGIWETISGAAVLILNKNVFHNILFHLTRAELLEYPPDKFIKFLTSTLNLYLHARIFIGVYILSHGILNIFLVYQLSRKRHWAYLVTIGFSVVFFLYQIYRIVDRHSYGLIIICVADSFFMWLTWREYRYQLLVDTNPSASHNV